ncbi:NUDIX hydrolase [Actinoallomurus sp. NPDC052308]|uniref:NUDIX hydrolase n=1 Tax=Actinoallomurus sp. NPDC052308 TaxID=3155530 RepID=UPI00343D36A5
MGAISASEAAPRPKVCDHRSVGIDIVGPSGERLMLQRVKPPVGRAPGAGHVDDHGSPEDAARAETFEELGLTVIRLRRLAGGWKPNRCRREVRSGCAVGHLWIIYRADVTGDINPGADEARNVAWHSPDQVRDLARRTIHRARGWIKDEEFARDPGLEPVWVDWYTQLGVINGVAEADLNRVRALYA